MIFSRLFTPKWKSKKVEQRLTAVSQLAKTKPEEQQILIQVANTDADEQVRIAALKQLNNIELWLQIYQDEQKTNIAAVAEMEIFNSSDLSTFSQLQLVELAHRVEKSAYQITLLTLINDINIKIGLLKKLNQKQHIISLFKECNESDQLALMPLMTQHGLEKTLEKFGNDTLKTKLKEQAEEKRLAKTKPLEVLNEAKLVLAKLNALRDKYDFELCEKQHGDLVAQWKSIDLSWLSEPQIQQNKFDEISEKLARHLAQLKETFEKQQQIAKHQDAVKIINEQCVALDNQLQSSFSELISDPEQAAISNCKQALNVLATACKELKLLGENTQQYDNKIALLNKQVNKIDDVLPQLKTLSGLVSQGYELPVAQGLSSFDQAQEDFNQWNQNLTQLITELPQTIKNSYIKEIKNISKDWNTKHQDLLKQIKDLQSSVSKQMKDVKRLINSGRFNVCFGLFKGIQADFLVLPASRQSKLSRDYDEIALKLDEVSDWQQQISLPKRHELLAEIEDKLSEENINIRQRSEWIKLTRKRWNELGYISSEEEKQLDNLFNQQLEAAFTPCRQFYSEQEQLRAKNVEKRQALIEKYQQLSESFEQANASEIEKQYFQLKQLWRNAGEVDSGQYKVLNQQLKPFDTQIKDFIKASQQSVAEQKSQLIEQAKKAINEEDIEQTVERLKVLQTQWKAIGFASKKVESKLWQEFRVINDEAFAKRDELRSASVEEKKQLIESFKVRFNSLTDADTVAATQEQITLLEELDSELKSHNLKTGLSSEINKRIEQLNYKAQNIHDVKNKAKFDSLFSSLEQGQIPSDWCQSSAALISRHRLTIRLEIINDLDSPNEDSSARLEEQVSLLQDKVKGNTNSNLQLLKMWLSHGDIDEQDLGFLVRIKSIFCGS